jgi:hypothetical protein
MVNKNLLQEELKEHIKEGIKPSDLKKLRKNNPPTAPANIPTPPPPPNLVNSESNQQDLLAKIKKLEAKNNSLTKTIQNLKDKQENQSINIGEKKLFVCYNCKLNHNLSLLVLELPEGKLCQDC